MYRVLIVEDEMLVRLGLKNSVNWPKFNMKVIGDAPDGESAWNIFNRDKPDIVITDIKMPVMDGMELIAKIREVNKSTKIVILTCLEEFNLAKKAMSFGVTDYILKLTMSEKDIESVLLRIKNELDGDSGRKAGGEEDKVVDYVIKENLLKGFLFGHLVTVEQFRHCVKKYKLRFSEKDLILCIMEIDHFKPGNPKFSNEKWELIAPSLINALNEMLEKGQTGEAFPERDGRYLLLYNPEKGQGERQMEDFTRNICEMLNIYFGITVSFGVSSVQSGFEKLREMYQQASGALELKFYLGPRSFLTSTTNIDLPFRAKIKKLGDIPNLKRLLGPRELAEYSQKIEALGRSVMPKDQMINNLCSLLQWVNCNIYSLFSVDVSKIVMSESHKLESSETLDECISIFEEFLNGLAESVEEENNYSSDISKAVKYIQIHYAHGVTLNQVAKSVNISPGYFSNLFKKELKMNFVEYLNQIRVEKAKKLLLGTGYKSYEIAEKVGFTENTYFCKVFKKLTGLSPNEYRKREAGKRPEETKNE